MKNFFVSDLHFGHTNVIKYDNRPYASVEEHDNAIISNWNNTVRAEDNVYILGDVAWYQPEKTVKILKGLNGRLHLIAGNHDGHLVANKDAQALFVEICDYKELTVGETHLVLCHYPMPCFNNRQFGWIHLYGHVHIYEEGLVQQSKRTIEAQGKPCEMYNVGIMMPYMGYRPRTLEEIIKGANDG